MVQHDIGLFFEPSRSKGLNPLRFPFWTIQNLPLSNYSWIRWWFLHILYLIFVKDLHGVQWKEICMELYGKSAYVLVLVCCCLEQKVHPWMRTRFQSATSTRSSQFKSCESTKASCQDDMKTCEEGIAGKNTQETRTCFWGIEFMAPKDGKAQLQSSELFVKVKQNIIL